MSPLLVRYYWAVNDYDWWGSWNVSRWQNFMLPLHTKISHSHPPPALSHHHICTCNTQNFLSHDLYLKIVCAHHFTPTPKSHNFVTTPFWHVVCMLISQESGRTPWGCLISQLIRDVVTGDMIDSKMSLSMLSTTFLWSPVLSSLSDVRQGQYHSSGVRTTYCFFYIFF